MANLLVPGTGGVTLIDGDGKDVGWPVLMRLKGIIRGVRGKSDDELFERMAMEHVPGQMAPSKTTLEPHVTLGPGRVLRVAYNQVEGFNKFRYDWRADMRYSAGQLHDFLVATQPSSGKWNLVGHSQGGLLIVIASKLMAAEDSLSHLVSTITLVGAPIAGTLNAAQAMIVGDNAGARLAPVMQRTIRTWPAIYQMLPSWSSVVRADGQPASDSRQLKQPGAWSRFGDVEPDLLFRAREVEPMLADPLSHMEGIDVRLFWAKNRDTDSRIRSPATNRRYETHETTKGDSLVPYDETMRWLGGAAIAPKVTAFGAPCEPHAYLFDDPTVVTQLRARLQ